MKIRIREITRIRVSAVEQTWHTQDSQGQILALAFRYKSLNPFARTGAGEKAGGGRDHYVLEPLSREYGTYGTVQARFWLCLSNKSL